MDWNRPREKAVYLKPDDAWGLNVWRERLPDDLVRTSLQEYDIFYDALREIYSELAARHGRFVVFDLHSYNRSPRRTGRPAADLPKPTWTKRH